MFELILNQAKIFDELGSVWLSFLLVFSRMAGFASLAPVIGQKAIPALVKISFAILLTLVMFPNIDLPSEYPSRGTFIYLIGMNALIGVLIAWIANLVIETVKTAGEIINMEMALHAATLFDPGSQSQTTIVGKFFDLLALVLFISVGGMEKLIEGLYKSFNLFPIVTYEMNITVSNLIKASSEVISMGFLLISPILMVLLAMDLILGLMSRAAPQINAFQVSFSLKPSTGLILLVLLLPALMPIFVSIFSNPMKYFY